MESFVLLPGFVDPERDIFQRERCYEMSSVIFARRTEADLGVSFVVHSTNKITR